MQTSYLVIFYLLLLLLMVFNLSFLRGDYFSHLLRDTFLLVNTKYNLLDKNAHIITWEYSECGQIVSKAATTMQFNLHLSFFIYTSHKQSIKHITVATIWIFLKDNLQTPMHSHFLKWKRTMKSFFKMK